MRNELLQGKTKLLLHKFQLICKLHIIKFRSEQETVCTVNREFTVVLYYILWNISKLYNLLNAISMKSVSAHINLCF